MCLFNTRCLLYVFFLGKGYVFFFFLKCLYWLLHIDLKRLLSERLDLLLLKNDNYSKTTMEITNNTRPT